MRSLTPIPYNLKPKERGAAALPITIGVLSIVFLVIVTVLSIGFSELFVAQRGTEYRRGVYEADFGANELLMRLSQNKDYAPGNYPLSALIQPQSPDNLTVNLAGGAAADCPELTIGAEDFVKIITSSADIQNIPEEQKPMIVTAKVVVKLESNGKLSICRWEGTPTD